VKEKMKHRTVRTLSLAATIAALTVIDVRAGEIGHFNGGILNIRDYIMPDSGLYGAVYNYFYTTGQLNNANGDAINSVIIRPGPGPGTKVGINVDVNLYALAPTLIWVTDIKPLGIKYGSTRLAYVRECQS